MADTLDLGQLRSLVAVATCGGVGRAAAALHLSQPAVSQHVRLLERRLQRALLVRDARGARLTAAGQQLVEEARRILAVHDEALARLSAATPAPLVVGCAEAAAEQVLPAVLASLRAAWPDRRVRFLVDRSASLAAGVARGTVDLAVVLGASGDAPGRLVGRLPLRWYAHEHAAPDDGGVVQVVAYTEPCALRTRALAELADAGRRAEVSTESTSLEGVVAAARAGLGVAALPGAGAPRAGLVERLDLPSLGVVGIHLATRRGLDLDVEAAALGALERGGEVATDVAPARHPAITLTAP
ncbi:LysR family transcriptional regulator [Cellulomonas sp. S1-8]|uniref:LysR family transcriptional regulator n=1 Tax=Cellulomonas sp. S1-8 TaxID=2904790 RepID=UPI0022441226|nr:LysR substrate-binding domain-containing protein [Cellulomonas sp. S1-8]UZN02048.1 LysR substrate-binding domain-containing protein [Cellulomonas sp. S1-8]